jgi:hypothetical protein
MNGLVFWALFAAVVLVVIEVCRIKKKEAAQKQSDAGKSDADTIPTPDEPEMPTAPPALPIEEPVPDAEPVMQDTLADTTILPISSKPDISFTLDTYASRLNKLEEMKRVLLFQAIAEQNAELCDKLQRELVVLTDRTALLVDSYTEETARFRQALHILTQLCEESGEQPALAEAIAALCQGHIEPAEAFLDTWIKHAHSTPGKIAFCRGLLAECQANLYQALTLYRQAAVSLDANDPQYLYATGRVARMLYDYQEAIPWLESFVRLARKNDDNEPLDLAFVQRDLAYSYVLAGQYRKAGQLYKNSMITIARFLGQDHHEMGTCWFQIGEVQEMQGWYDKALVLYKKALEIIEKRKGAEHPALAAILNTLAALYMELEREDEAVPLYERLVLIREKTLRPNHMQLAINLDSLAEAYRITRRYEDAEACYLKILKINEAVHGQNHPGVATVLQTLAKVNLNMNRPETAKQYQERATTIFQKNDKGHKNDNQRLTLNL